MEISRVKAFNNKMEHFIDMLLPELEEIYKDIHRNQKVSMWMHFPLLKQPACPIPVQKWEGMKKEQKLAYRMYAGTSARN